MYIHKAKYTQTAPGHTYTTHGVSYCISCPALTSFSVWYKRASSTRLYHTAPDCTTQEDTNRTKLKRILAFW